MKLFQTIEDEIIDECVIEKSRFITYVKPVDTEEEATHYLEQIRKKHWDATHHVPGWILGYNRTVQKFSDDGEPSGTAGLPVLEAIKNSGYINIAVVVVRYFGGIKLGTGGLVRAYGSSARQALEKTVKITVESHREIQIGMDYSWLGKLQAWLAASELPDGGTDYTDRVIMKVYCPTDQVEKLCDEIVDLTHGTAQLEIGDSFYLGRTQSMHFKYHREVRP